jgi:MoxR-like ATPase
METMKQIVEVHFPGIKQQLLTTALTQFYEIRDQQGLKKKPSTSEVLDWLKLLLAEDLSPRTCAATGPPPCPSCTARF